MRRDTHSSRSTRRLITSLGVFVLFAGMLFWTKLRLVSDIPRTAYAVPKQQDNPTTTEDATTESETTLDVRSEDKPVDPHD